MRSRWMRNTCGLCVTNSLTPEDQFHISANITIVDSRRLAVHQWTFISHCVQSQAAFTRLAVHPNHQACAQKSGLVQGQGQGVRVRTLSIHVILGLPGPPSPSIKPVMRLLYTQMLPRWLLCVDHSIYRHFPVLVYGSTACSFLTLADMNTVHRFIFVHGFLNSFCLKHSCQHACIYAYTAVFSQMLECFVALYLAVVVPYYTRHPPLNP